ncbi:uncharacterized protein K460DRAFT_356194 [Cucurbitaria berberidis CBS 394.84]|uniref:Uncharacterized protein n=1 Tax=Cucurbitaria berberidis CBS 394.84 TaxID=1168544 RepID=A0A9P4L9N0_9PLEO|nr:uncharacterized protein K460DRAFT_356194 [Cucurbitaria berberidis CBS 394.84]KAF1846532.1 hypothetical protein K460DRAFT_356194 [Cucurbitaria berberidis CBS 394.84]
MSASDQNVGTIITRLQVTLSSAQKAPQSPGHKENTQLPRQMLGWVAATAFQDTATGLEKANEHLEDAMCLMRQLSAFDCVQYGGSAEIQVARARITNALSKLEHVVVEVRRSVRYK